MKGAGKRTKAVNNKRRVSTRNFEARQQEEIRVRENRAARREAVQQRRLERQQGAVPKHERNFANERANHFIDSGSRRYSYSETISIQDAMGVNQPGTVGTSRSKFFQLTREQQEEMWRLYETGQISQYMGDLVRYDSLGDYI